VLELGTPGARFLIGTNLGAHWDEGQRRQALRFGAWSLGACHRSADAHITVSGAISEHVTSEKDRQVFLRMARESRELYCAILDGLFVESSRRQAA
jgi:hypothetical protein